MASTTHKCGWKHCKHPSSEIPSGEGVQIGNRWYHEDCGAKSVGILEIKDYYYEHIDKAVVMKQLVAAINSVVINKEVDPKFVLFALKYAIKNNIPVRSPYGIHYLVTNHKIKDAWQRYKAKMTAVAISRKPVEQKVEFVPPQINTDLKYEENKIGFGTIFQL